MEKFVPKGLNSLPLFKLVLNVTLIHIFSGDIIEYSA